MAPTQLLTTKQAAERLNISADTLRWWRYQGTGPRSFRLSPRKVMYRADDLEAWLEERYSADQVSA